eukprot:COSAG06_NODE_1219_length_10212_cov_51.453080_12_plen_455_part_00
MIATLPSASNQRRRTVLTRQHPECKQTELARERAAGQPHASTAEHTHRLSSTHMSMRIVYAPETVPLSTLSSNSDATGSRASANRSRRKGRPATKQAAAKGSCNPSPRHAARGRARAGCPNGPARSGKRRANPHGANRRTHGQSCGSVHPTAVDQLSLMLAASQLGSAVVPPVDAPMFNESFVLMGGVIAADDDDDDDECCGEMDPYTARVRGCGTQPAEEEPDAEDAAIQAALAHNFDTTNTLLDEHATRHQECIVLRWQAQQQQYSTHNTQTNTHSSSQDNSSPRKLVLIDEAAESADEHQEHHQSGTQSPVADVPDSPMDENTSTLSDEASVDPKPAVAAAPDPEAEHMAQAAELKEQGKALMAAGDYINAGGTFGIARGLNPNDAELRELEDNADRMAEAAAEAAARSVRHHVHRPAPTKSCGSQYARMYEAWLSSGRPEMRGPVAMAVC